MNRPQPRSSHRSQIGTSTQTSKKSSVPPPGPCRPVLVSVLYRRRDFRLTAIASKPNHSFAAGHAPKSDYQYGMWVEAVRFPPCFDHAEIPVEPVCKPMEPPGNEFPKSS